MSRSRFALIVALAAAAGCSSSSSESAGPVCSSGKCDSASQQQALQSLQLLGANVEGSTPRCKECHSLTRSNLRQWLSMSKTFKATCLKDGMAPLDSVNCMRADPANAESPFVPNKLGIYAAGAHLPDMQALFKKAYPADAPGNTTTTWLRQYTKFKQTVSMPRGNYDKLTAEQFGGIGDWFGKELPDLEAVLPEAMPPASCTDRWTPELDAHLARMKNEGWAAVNKERGMSMHGCGGATDALGCLASLPLASAKDYAQGWSVGTGTLRVVKDLSFHTTFWSRSSSSGRFFAAGGVKIIDLQTDKEIPVEASYDPGFFPDDSGFLFQGTPVGSGICNFSLLMRSPDSINFHEAECTGGSLSLYQYLGASLGGGDYFVVTSQFDSDNGGHGATLHDPAATFGGDATIKMTPMVFDGSTYQVGAGVKVPTEFEGDTALSPSTLLTAGRLAGPNARQIGYVIRKVAADKQAGGYTITAPEVGRVCVRGGKANFSLDERFLATHHYVEKDDATALGFTGPDDPAFAPYVAKGAANIVVVDLVTHRTVTVTRMNPGQYALYPHFRNDGWMYFLVRDVNNGGAEHIVASDAAIRLAAE
jgi:hypothetical protein